MRIIFALQSLLYYTYLSILYHRYPSASMILNRWFSGLRTQSSLWKTQLPCKVFGTQSGSRYKNLVPIKIVENDLDEQFVKGSGKGGQKINKVRNCVLLKHIPTGLHVRCQKTRSLEDNRRIARKLMMERLDDFFNMENSAKNMKIEKLRKKKANRRARSISKHSKSSQRRESDQLTLEESCIDKSRKDTGVIDNGATTE